MMNVSEPEGSVTAVPWYSPIIERGRVPWAVEFDAQVPWDPSQPIFFTLEELQQGYVVLDILGVLYLFGALAIVCSSYFVPSVEKITHECHISPSVAGAGIMAVGVSIPNIAAIMFGTFVAHNELGLGGVLGGAFWNALIIPAICGLVLREPMALNPRNVIRDIGAFTVAGLALLCATYDNIVTTWDAVMILLVYLVYILTVALSGHISNLRRRCFNCCRSADKEETEALTECDSRGKSLAAEPEERKLDIHQEENDVTEYRSQLNPPYSWCGRVFWLLWLPIIFVYWLLIPDYRRPKWNWVYPLTFVISLVFIALVSFLIVWLVSVIGLALELPVTVTGITILAIGSNLPDTFNSVFAAQDGFGEMALSNAFGGSILQMLVCLGIPWLTETIMTYPEPMELQESVILPVILIAVSGVSSLTFLWVKSWRITPCMSVLFILMYASIIVSTIVYQMFGPEPDAS